MDPKKKNENAKAQEWKVPMGQTSVKPEQYIEAGESANATDANPAPEPADTLAGFDDTHSSDKGSAKVE